MNIVQSFEARHLASVSEGREIPVFSVGDTVRVNVKVREGTRERVQAYEGVCIARSGSDINASFTVRKISSGEGVERVFPLFSPRIDSIELIRRGSVRRAKLYYLRDRRGKAARISERTTGHGLDTDEAAKEAARQEKVETRKARRAERQEARKTEPKLSKEARKESRASVLAEKKAAKRAAAEAEKAAAEEGAAES